MHTLLHHTTQAYGLSHLAKFCGGGEANLASLISTVSAAANPSFSSEEQKSWSLTTEVRHMLLYTIQTADFSSHKYTFRDALLVKQFAVII